MTTEQWERENQDTLMEYFIDGDPSVRRIQRKSLKKRAERGTYTCACCGEQFLPIRADARYCSNACRQKDYRKRKVTAHASL